MGMGECKDGLIVTEKNGVPEMIITEFPIIVNGNRDFERAKCEWPIENSSRGGTSQIFPITDLTLRI